MSRKFRVEDKVKVVGMSPVTFAPGVKDELGTEKKQSMENDGHRRARSCLQASGADNGSVP
jgi:hypothetical protein